MGIIKGTVKEILYQLRKEEDLFRKQNDLLRENYEKIILEYDALLIQKDNEIETLKSKKELKKE